MDKRARRVKAGKMTEQDFELAAVKVNDQEFGQEQLLYVAFHLLLNLSEETAVEAKMVRKGVVQQLGEGAGYTRASVAVVVCGLYSERWVLRAAECTVKMSV